MKYYVNYGKEKLYFDLPKGWNLISFEDRLSIPGINNPLTEIRNALDHPVGSPKIEMLAKPGMKVVILFDDLQRPTPAHLVIPEILDRLNKAGIPDSDITAICALGTHPIPSIETLKTKAGEETFLRLNGRIFSHDPHSKENVLIGKTHWGTPVEINPYVAHSDLIIGIGECMPHPSAGFGGGFKIIMPGVCSYKTTAHHHFTWMRHKNSRINILDGNPYYEDIVDAGRLSGLKFKIDFIINEKKEIIKAFAGDPFLEHKAASNFARSILTVSLPKIPDVSITAAYPMEIGVQSTKALLMASNCTKNGGIIIWVAPQREAGPILPLIQEMGSDESATSFHRRLMEGDIPDHLKPFGISYIMQVVHFKEIAQKYNVIHVTEGLAPELIRMMKFSYAADLQKAIEMAYQKRPNADIAIFPSGGSIIPDVR